MITAAQLRAARALLGIDQRELAERCGLSVPTIQRMEASEGVIRGNVDSLMKLVSALNAAGIELISDNETSAAGGRGVDHGGGQFVHGEVGEHRPLAGSCELHGDHRFVRGPWINRAGSRAM